MPEISVITMSPEEVQEMITTAVEKSFEAQRLRTSSDDGTHKKYFSPGNRLAKNYMSPFRISIP